MDVTERFERDLDDATEFVLNNKQANVFLWWVLNQCGIYTVTGAGNSMTYFNEGKRNVGLAIINRICSVEPEAYARLMLSQRLIEAADLKAIDDETAKTTV